MPFFLFFALATVGIMLAMVFMSERKNLRERVRTLAGDSRFVPREELLQRSFAERVLLPGVAILAKTGARLIPLPQQEKTRRKLQLAGLKASAHQRFLAAKGLGLLVGLAVGWCFLAINPRLALLAGGLAAFAGFIAPDKWLDHRIAKRREAIVRSLPDTLDLITAGSEAGLSFDAAVQRIVARRGQGDRELREEFARYLADVGLGQSRAEALADLAYRCGVDDMKAIVAALLQADQLGIGVGTVLRTQSAGLRTLRRQRAQEQAMKAPIKMLFPLVFFIFPSIFVIILGPAAIQIMDQFLR